MTVFVQFSGILVNTANSETLVCVLNTRKRVLNARWRDVGVL